MVGTAQKRTIAGREEPLKICLLGNLNGTQTRHGLRYFFDAIWPLYLASDLVGKIRFVVIGGGELPPQIPWPASHPDLVATGFVRDLDAALADVSALLVSIPNTLGFRMRILEAFKQGIPVIAHEAACAGMPELTEETAFLGAAPHDFLEAFRELIADPQRAERRAEAGARCFDGVFAAGRVAEKLAPFFEQIHPLHLAPSRHDDR